MSYKKFQYIKDYKYDGGWDSFALVYAQLLKPDTVYTLTKEMMYKILEKHMDFSKENTVLDLGCGTGNDFPYFLKNNCKIVACDYSKGMLNKAAERYEKEIKENKVSLLYGDLQNLEKNTFSPHSFDLIFAITGSLSYINNLELQDLLKKMKPFLKPNGKIVMAHFGKFCIAESLFYLKNYNFRQVFTRLQKKISVSIKGEEFFMYLRTPRSIKSIVKSDFKLEAIYPLLVATPPYQTKYISTVKALKRHKKLEELFLDQWYWAYFSDQFVSVLSK